MMRADLTFACTRKFLLEGGKTMFGYVRPNVPELLVKDNELYRATYCGLCRTMGKTTGKLSKLTLSYDFVFLALLRLAVKGEAVEVKLRRCPVHPFKKRPMIEVNDELVYSARVSTILTRLKLKDNINDSHGFSRVKAKIAGGVSVFFKKTDKSLIELEEKTVNSIDELTKLEKESSDSIDKTSSTFGILLANLASYGIEGANGRILYDVGYHLGRLIYVMDAVDDFEKDIKSGSFNVIKNAYGEKLDESIRQNLKCSMLLELEKISRGIELIDFFSAQDCERIIKNIVYIGLPNEIKRVASGEKRKKEQKPSSQNA